MAIVIIYGILLTIITGAALAALVLVVQRLPKSDYREVDNLSTNFLSAWERGYEYGRQNAVGNPAVTLPALRVAERPEPEVEPGPYVEPPEAEEIAKY